jgi:hypothetical protein
MQKSYLFISSDRQKYHFQTGSRGTVAYWGGTAAFADLP